MKTLIAAMGAALLPLAPIACAQPVSAAENPRFEPTRFSVEIVGEGRDVILIPGLSTPREVWVPTAERLKATHRVHLVQIRGFGEQAGPNAEGEVLQPVVDELARYIEANGLRDSAIVGHSLGGLAALMLGADYPGLPGRIMAVDAAPFIGSLMIPGATLESFTPQAEAMRSMLLARAEASKGMARSELSDCDPVKEDGAAPQGAMTNTRRGACLVGNWAAQSDPVVVAQAMYDDMTTDMRERVREIEAPLTVLYAQDDRLNTAEAAAATWDEAYTNAPDAKLILVPGSYHFIMLDQPGLFHAELDEFLAE